ncbi:AzlD family protein [Salipiger bermudensis]|uniref:AzlD family protein n=1 Tax=Salipiger bermudensis TaxID=344736 RepID=UPI001CD62F56|nr:AzlD domain-containing protein [Salipiger bermudensis]MCA0964780.1 AzlD domain-containing protein [Salipiger bermudensis]
MGDPVSSTWVAISLLVAVTLATRLAGPLAMARIGASPRVERFLEGVSVSVLAALVASIVAQGGTREAVAVGLAGVVMLATQSAVWAMIAGMVLAAGWTAIIAI